MTYGEMNEQNVLHGSLYNLEVISRTNKWCKNILFCLGWIKYLVKMGLDRFYDKKIYIMEIDNIEEFLVCKNILSEM